MASWIVSAVFDGLWLAMFAHIALSWWRAAVPYPPLWISHPVILWIDEIGGVLLRPFRRLCDRVGVTRLTHPLDLSPILAFLTLDGVRRLLMAFLFREIG